MIDIQIGDHVLVKAWWSKDRKSKAGEVLKCQIQRVSQHYDIIDVQPLEGNPHIRSIKLVDVVEKLTRVDWPAAPASCCGEPKLASDVDRCYDHAKKCDICDEPADDSRKCPTHKEQS